MMCGDEDLLDSQSCYPAPCIIPRVNSPPQWIPFDPHYPPVSRSSRKSLAHSTSLHGWNAYLFGPSWRHPDIFHQSCKPLEGPVVPPGRSSESHSSRSCSGGDIQSRSPGRDAHGPRKCRGGMHSRSDSCDVQ